MLFGSDGTLCFARQMSRDYKKGKLSHFLKKFLRQPQPSTSEFEPKKVENIPFIHLWHNRVNINLVDTAI